MANHRVNYPIIQLAIKPNANAPTSEVAPLNSRTYVTGPLASGVDEVVGRWEVPRGLQSAGMSTTFNLEPVFEMGQVEIYENSERQPEIEMTLNKAIDGSKPLFFMVTDPSGANNIVSRTANYLCDVTMQIYPDSQYRSTGRPVAAVTASGMVPSSYTLTFPIDGFVTEEVSLVGNDKVWGHMLAISGQTLGQDNNQGAGEPLVVWPDDIFKDNAGSNPAAPEGLPSGVFGHDGNTSALQEGGAQELAGPPDRGGVIVVGSGIQRREEVDIRRSVLPQDIPGVTTFIVSGIDAAYVNGGFGSQGDGTLLGTDIQIGDANTDNIVEHIQNITVSIDLGRDDIFEMGSKRPFAKTVTFPIETTSSFEVITAQGDLVDATSSPDIGADNTVAANTIIIRTNDGMQVDLGDANRLTGVDMAGGDAGGDNMTITYNYITYNTFNVTHDFYWPNTRVMVFETGNSRFNIGASSWKRSDLGIF